MGTEDGAQELHKIAVVFVCQRLRVRRNISVGFVVPRSDNTVWLVKVRELCHFHTLSLRLDLHFSTSEVLPAMEPVNEENVFRFVQATATYELHASCVTHSYPHRNNTVASPINS